MGIEIKMGYTYYTPGYNKGGNEIPVKCIVSGASTVAQNILVEIELTTDEWLRGKKLIKGDTSGINIPCCISKRLLFNTYSSCENFIQRSKYN